MKHILFQKIRDYLITIIGISIISFLIIRLIPGDPVTLMLGERGASPEVIEQLRENLGLDKPLYIQYFKFMSSAIQGDLGSSYLTNQKVTHEFLSRFPATLELGICAMLFAIVIGIPCGVFAAVKRNSFFDYFLMSSSLTGYSMPIFWWALILIIVFSVGLGITPVAGRINIAYDIDYITGFLLLDTLLSPELIEEEGFKPFFSALHHLILPALTMGTIPLAVIARMTRSSMLEILGEPYIMAARARGLSDFRLHFFHALKNALIPVVTVIGLLFGSIVTGAILTETIYSWPGIGKWLVASIFAHDYPAIQGAILFIAIIIVSINLFVDILYGYINPRMRDS